MPGSSKSMPKTAEPSTLAGASTRGSGLPRSCQSACGLRTGFWGAVFLLAASASCPKVSRREVRRWWTLPRSTVQEPAGTFHRSAAAATSISRALAPTWRINSKKDMVLSLLPVNCHFRRGLR